MAKAFNEEYFQSITGDAAKRRYAQWLIEFPSWGRGIFDNMYNALKAGNDPSLSDSESEFPQETEWFRKHLEKDPEAIAVQVGLFGHPLIVKPAADDAPKKQEEFKQNELFNKPKKEGVNLND